MTSSHRNSGPGQHSRALLSKLDDSGPQQLVEVKALTGQTIGEAVRVLHGGFSSHPPNDSEGLVMMLGGGADRAYALGLEDPKHRPRNLPEGASILYQTNDNTNHVYVDADTIRAQHKKRVLLKVGDDVTVTMNTDSITLAKGGISLLINSDGFHFSGGVITHDGHSVDKTHVHTDGHGVGNSGPPP